ncbi:hypothetical protein GF339_17255 [candidate division KSB3 bacterium]|uniref:Uncharacterized protein n=1 Tax=candidate division KSB3 bacterium TaxID=2044937 RepID=A0A9D5JYZ1_9BACT|nr:hypothetical protein [candidate division KSB3 bacterium]MBD3326336.1 hypothetical protein [candidate division KSB3 bacterium]
MQSISTHFKQGFSLVQKTLPYMGMRLLIYGIYALGAIIYFLIAFLLTRIFGGAGGIIMLVMIGIFGAFYYWSRRYLLYMIKAGHVAVFTELYEHGSLPSGTSQFQYGKDLVKRRVKDLSILFTVDALVDGILRTFSRSVASIADLLPLPGLEGIARAGTAIINRALTYVDEAIFSYNILHDEENLWASSKAGVILYAQSWKPLLKTAVAVWLVEKVFFVLVLILWMIPFGTFALMTSSDGLKAVFLIVAIILAVLTDRAVFEPVALATMVITYQDTVKEMTPDPQWEAKLESVSEKFRELKQKAMNAASGSAEAPAS